MFRDATALMVATPVKDAARLSVLLTSPDVTAEHEAAPARLTVLASVTDAVTAPAALAANSFARSAAADTDAVADTLAASE